MKSGKTTKSGYLSIAAAALAGLAVALTAGTASADKGLTTAVGSDVSAMELRALTIESFDKDYTGRGYGWEVHTNKDTTYSVDKKEDYNPDFANKQVERAAKLIKGTPRDVKENTGFENAYVLGVKFAFTFPGENIVTVRPPQGVDHYVVERPRPYLNELAFSKTHQNRSCFKDASRSGSRASERAQVVDCLKGVELPGQVKAISVWVNGRGNEYDLEGWIEDWKGDTHILKFGSLDFVGWRPMTAMIPKGVPQDVSSFPQVKTLVFRQFKIRARSNTSLEPVYLFFDELRILTDIFEVHFDGAQIDFDKPDCLTKQRLFALIRKNVRSPESFPDVKDCEKAPGPVGPIPDITPKEAGGKEAPKDAGKKGP